MGFGFIDVTPPVGPTVLALAWAQIVIYAIGLAVIAWQLWQMQQAGQHREREIDAMAARLSASNHALEESTRRLGLGLAETPPARRTEL